MGVTDVSSGSFVPEEVPSDSSGDTVLTPTEIIPDVGAVSDPKSGPNPSNRAPATATATSATNINNKPGPLPSDPFASREIVDLLRRGSMAITPFATNYMARVQALCWSSPLFWTKGVPTPNGGLSAALSVLQYVDEFIQHALQTLQRIAISGPIPG